VLIGFMGTGKTTVGKLLAGRLGRRFVDLDRAIEAEAGAPIAELFRTEGEPAFRAREAEALRRALGASESLVIATGGGAACREENLQAMLDRGIVVNLTAPAAELVARTGRHSGRPLLDGAADPVAAAAALLAQREPFYARAHVRVDTSGKNVDEVADEILTRLRGEGGS
jgi:shikimate kinase